MRTLLLISLLCSGSVLFSQNFEEVVKVVASDRDETDRMGYAVTIDGNWAAVGAYGNDFGALNPNMGAVYIYEQQGLNNWVETQLLTNDDQDDYDRFGWSVDMDGDFLIVGAYGEDHDENDANSLSKAGSAYIFQNISGTWTQMQKIVASDRDVNDEFGWSVAIYDSTAIVGAHIEDHDEFGADFKYHSGSAYAFELDGTGTWNETQKIVADDRWVDMNFPNGYSGEDLADQFGGSLDLWGDYLIVGAHSHDYATTSPLSGALWTSGAAYIFERTAGTWNQVQKIQNFDRESWDRFGYSCAIDSNVIAVSAYSEDEEEDGVTNPLTNPGSVYLFERDLGGTWNAAQKIVPDDRNSGDHFGWSIDIDDTLMVLGCHSDDHDEFGLDLKPGSGSAYIFEKNAGVWSQYQKIDASVRHDSVDFGVSVGISGHTVLTGAQFEDFDEVEMDSIADAGAAYFHSNNLCPILDTTDVVTICGGNAHVVGTSSYSSSGMYTDIVVSVGGCDSTVHTDLTVTPEIMIDEYATMCDGGVYYIFGSPTYVPGNYSYTLQSQSGCDSTIITHLTMDAPIVAENYVSICYGETYSIGANTYDQTGTYEDVVSATNFCDSTITTYLTVELPPNTSISKNISQLSANQPNASYQWFDCDTGLDISGETNQNFFASEVGTYGVIVTLNGCVDTSGCVYVGWIVADLESFKFDDQIQVFPNPTTDNFTISSSVGFNNTSLSIYNSLGQLIHSEILIGNEVSTYTLASGVYILEFREADKISRKKVVVE
jgi:FG-GAP repeat/Secretion system C-terminal sorting domain